MADANEPVVTELPEKVPVDDAPVTQKQGAADIADLLPDDLLGEEPDGSDEDKTAKPDTSDPLGEDDEPEADGKTATKEDGPQTGAGQYVSPNAKFKLADGREITVAELARNNLFHDDYSKKTEGVAREREAITKEKAEVAQVSQTVAEERKFLLWFAETYAPQPPQPPQMSARDDPVAHLEYQERLGQYNAMAQAYHSMLNGQKQEEQRKGGETQAQADARAKTEIGTLWEKIPMLKEPAKAKAFFETLEAGGKEHYGFSQDEIANAIKSDHRMGLALRDAIAYRRAKAKAPALQKELAAKPKPVRGSASRTEPQLAAQRTNRLATERLRKSGSMADAVDAIAALI